jgi:glyoxylase-like metal-dependent hydrolase (beta-lactamase superfamily II)
MPLLIHTIVSYPFQENTYLVWQPNRQDVLVIDPGMQPEQILAFLREQGLTAAAILNTHGHLDHIAGNGAVKDAFPQIPIIIGENDAVMLSDPAANFSAEFGVPVTSPPADQLVREEDVLDLAGIRLEVLDVPGHSPGHVVFVYRDTPDVVFGGDVLFREGIGRTDFPGGDGPRLLRGIREKLFTLPDATVVYPGHGPATAIGHEKTHNPFVGNNLY